jgi:hypothetical protein
MQDVRFLVRQWLASPYTLKDRAIMTVKKHLEIGEAVKAGNLDINGIIRKEKSGFYFLSNLCQCHTLISHNLFAVFNVLRRTVKLLIIYLLIINCLILSNPFQSFQDWKVLEIPQFFTRAI